MTDTALIELWRSVLAEGDPGLHLVDPSHTLQVFVGASDLGAPRLVIRSLAKPSTPTLSDVVQVDRYEDKGGKWNLVFTLQDQRFREVFFRLSDDICARTASAVNENTALDCVAVVVEEWRRLMKPRPTGLLSVEELRGLIGELWLLLWMFGGQRSIDEAVEGWLGPMGLPQDFWYADLGFIEAKSIGPATVRVQVSSEHQFDADPLQLAVIRVANAAETTAGAVNLPLLINRVRAGLTESAVTHDALDGRLTRLGVDVHQTWYQETWFVVARVTTYDTSGGFPAIRNSELPVGVRRVRYEIELEDIGEFVQSDVEIG